MGFDFSGRFRVVEDDQRENEVMSKDGETSYDWGIRMIYDACMTSIPNFQFLKR